VEFALIKTDVWSEGEKAKDSSPAIMILCPQIALPTGFAPPAQIAATLNILTPGESREAIKIWLSFSKHVLSIACFVRIGIIKHDPYALEL
jgi:hypothetical protein